MVVLVTEDNTEVEQVWCNHAVIEIGIGVQVRVDAVLFLASSCSICVVCLQQHVKQIPTWSMRVARRVLECTKEANRSTPQGVKFVLRLKYRVRAGTRILPWIRGRLFEGELFNTLFYTWPS